MSVMPFPPASPSMVAPAAAALPPMAARGAGGVPTPGMAPPPTSAPAPPVSAATGNPYFPSAIDRSFGENISDTIRQQYPLQDAPQELTTDRERLLWAVGHRALAMIKQGAEARLPRDEMVRDSLRAVFMIPPDRVSPMGVDGANLRTPLTYQAFATLHAFFYEVATGVRPYAKTEATKKGDKDAANKIEDLLDSYLTEQLSWEAVQDTAISLAIQEGIAFLKPCWVRQVGKVREYTRLTVDNAEDFGFVLPKRADLRVDGAVVQHKRSKETARLGQLIDGTREVLIKNAPHVAVISYFDYVQYPARAKTVESAYLSGHKCYKTIGELRIDAKSRMYDGAAVHALELTGYKPITPETPTHLLFDNSATRDEFDEDEYEDAAALMDSLPKGPEEPAKPSKRGGKDQAVRGVGKPDDTVELVEFVMRFDGDGDDLEEDWLFTLETSTGRLLKAMHAPNTPGLRYLRPMVVFAPSEQTLRYADWSGVGRLARGIGPYHEHGA